MLDAPNILELAETLGQEINDLIAIVAEEIKPSGPQQRVYSNVKPINVRIAPTDIEIARMLGGGNISEGLRVALQLIAGALKNTNRNTSCAPRRGYRGRNIK